MTAGERMAAYQEAFRAANGKDIAIQLKKGWFYVGSPPHQSKWRGKKLDECAAVLRERAAAEGLA